MDAAETLNPPILLPAQFFPGPGPESWSPEKRLMAAVLEEAVAEYRAAERPGGSRLRERRLRAELTAWFLSSAVSGPFCFLTICHVLDLDPAGVRGALRRPRRLPP